jgi:8-oxo-dGTP pyrophosphatase MutT (NUDIX family)
MKNWHALLQAELSGTLPGIEIQLKMAPPIRRMAVNAKSVRNSSVMVLVYPYQGFLNTVFIKRIEYKGVHSGQISFPGGMCEPGDHSPVYTALRETFEEIGIPPSAVSVIGQLTPLHIPVSNVNVYPVVGTTEDQPVFMPNQAEVKYLIETPLEDLIDPLNCKAKLMQVHDHMIKVPYYDIRDNHIWGATAMIVSEFLDVVKKSGISLRSD